MTKPIIVDAHVHLHRTSEQGEMERTTYDVWEYGTKTDVRYSTCGGDLESVVTALKEANAYKGVVVNLFEATADGDHEYELLKSNAWFCNAVKGHPTLIPFIGFDPGFMEIDMAKDHISEMVSQHGAKGIKLHPTVQQFYLHDPRMLPICELCVELDIPILSHCGPGKEAEQYAEPKAYVEILKRVPSLRLTLAHLGGGAWDQTVEFAQAFPNTYFDCSEIIQWTGGRYAPTDRELAQLVLDVGPEKVMMGSDFPWYDIDHTVERVLELPLLSMEQKEKILGENAIRFLHL